MKLKLNFEYARNHLGVAVLFFALGSWFAYDGAIGWPAENSAWEKRTGITVAAALAAHPELAHEHIKDNRNDIPPHWPEDIARQFQFAGLLGIAAAIIAGLIALDWKRTLEWDEEKMWGSLTGGKPVPFTDVIGIEDPLWEKKGIITLCLRDDRKLKLDAWHHAGVKELVAEVLKRTGKRQLDGNENK